MGGKRKDRWYQLQQMVHYVQTGEFLDTSICRGDRAVIRRFTKFKFRQRGSRVYYIGNNKSLKCKNKTSKEPPRIRLVITSIDEKDLVMREIHDNGGHEGNFRTQAKIKQKYYWFSITEDVREWVRNCPKCKESRKVKKKKLPDEISEEQWTNMLGPDTFNTLQTQHVEKGLSEEIVDRPKCVCASQHFSSCVCVPVTPYVLAKNHFGQWEIESEMGAQGSKMKTPVLVPQQQQQHQQHHNQQHQQQQQQQEEQEEGLPELDMRYQSYQLPLSHNYMHLEQHPPVNVDMKQGIIEHSQPPPPPQSHLPHNTAHHHQQQQQHTTLQSQTSQQQHQSSLPPPPLHSEPLSLHHGSQLAQTNPVIPGHELAGTHIQPEDGEDDEETVTTYKKLFPPYTVTKLVKMVKENWDYYIAHEANKHEIFTKITEELRALIPSLTVDQVTVKWDNIETHYRAVKEKELYTGKVLSNRPAYFKYLEDIIHVECPPKGSSKTETTTTATAGELKDYYTPLKELFPEEENKHTMNAPAGVRIQTETISSYEAFASYQNMCRTTKRKYKSSDRENWLYLQHITRYVRFGKYPTISTKEEKVAIKKAARSYVVEGRKVYYIDCIQENTGGGKQKIFIPIKRRLITTADARDTVLIQLHDLDGHHGVKETIVKIYHQYYWLDIFDDVREWINNCPKCRLERIEKMQLNEDQTESELINNLNDNIDNQQQKPSLNPCFTDNTDKLNHRAINLTDNVQIFNRLHSNKEEDDDDVHCSEYVSDPEDDVVIDGTDCIEEVVPPPVVHTRKRRRGRPCIVYPKDIEQKLLDALQKYWGDYKLKKIKMTEMFRLVTAELQVIMPTLTSYQVMQKWKKMVKQYESFGSNRRSSHRRIAKTLPFFEQLHNLLSEGSPSDPIITGNQFDFAENNDEQNDEIDASLDEQECVYTIPPSSQPRYIKICPSNPVNRGHSPLDRPKIRVVEEHRLSQLPISTDEQSEQSPNGDIIYITKSENAEKVSSRLSFSDESGDLIHSGFKETNTCVNTNSCVTNTNIQGPSISGSSNTNVKSTKVQSSSNSDNTSLLMEVLDCVRRMETSQSDINTQLSKLKSDQLKLTSEVNQQTNKLCEQITKMKYDQTEIRENLKKYFEVNYQRSSSNDSDPTV